MAVKVFPAQGAHHVLQDRIQAWLDEHYIYKLKGVHAGELRLVIDYWPMHFGSNAPPLRVILFNATHEEEKLERLINEWEATEHPEKYASVMNEFYWFVFYTRGPLSNFK